MARIQIRAVCERTEERRPVVFWIETYLTIEKGDVVQTVCPLCSLEHGMEVLDV